MLSYVLRKLGYGHVVEPSKVVKPYVPLHSVIPSYGLLEYVSTTRDSIQGIMSPLIDDLPFTPIEYLAKGVERYITGFALSGGVSTIQPTDKFLSKRLVNMPTHFMSDIEFVNLLSNTLFDLDKNTKFIPYILLSHEDVVLNSTTSNNFRKAAISLTVPLEIIEVLSKVTISVDVVKDNDQLHYFSLTFTREDGRWWFNAIDSLNPLTILSPFELFMYAWETILIDIDHIVNRSVRKCDSGFTDYGVYYNARTKYDISDALFRIASLIDLELSLSNIDKPSIRSIITEHGLSLSSGIEDFRTALYKLKDTGSKVDIKL